MFVVELERFYVKIFAAGFFFPMFAVFAAGIMPKVFGVPAIVTVLAFIRWCAVCAYRTERFTTYARFRLFTNIFLAPMLAFVLTLAVSAKLFKLEPLAAVALSCVPFVMVGLAYAVVCHWPSDLRVLNVVGTRVEVLPEVPSHSPWLVGLSAAVGSLSYSMFREYGSLYIGLIFLAISISIYMVFYSRHSIASLRALRRQETLEGCHYTFMNIEGIREKRAASWLGRFFAIKHKR